ncbi:MAG: flavodoxin [Tractidigestivibacter sp.]|uniref:flavodoxin n=1 Tax=Tractidigestivibacter sp. TaxID=2847320 RepID=UPI003D89D850
MNALIMYYSRKGRTEQLAKTIQSDLGCDILKIEPDKPFGNFVSVLSRESHDRNKPENGTHAVTAVPDLSGYDVVLVGYPIWQTEMPEFLAQFLEACDFAGKTVIPFATCASTGIQPSLKRMSTVVGTDCDLLNPLCFGAGHHDDYRSWLNKTRELAELAANKDDDRDQDDSDASDEEDGNA